MGARRSGWVRRRPILTAACVLILVACAWVPGVLRGHQLTQSYGLVADPPFTAGGRPLAELPQRWVFPDAARTFHPWQVIAREQLQDGHLPLWNPYEYGGMELLANMQSALAFPLSWIALLISPDVAAGLIAIAKLALAGLGAFVLAREVGLRAVAPALLAGVVYMVAAPMVVWLQWPVSTAVAVYPWLIAATHRLALRPGPGPVAAVAAAVTLVILAGHPETALAAVSAAAVFLVGLLVAGRRPLREAIAGALRWLSAGALGAAGAAVVVLPFARAFDDSATKAFRALTADDLPYYTAVQFLAPHLFGNAQPGVYGVAFYTAVAGYFGVPALMLAIVALWRRRRDPALIALAATALVALMATYQLPPVSWFTSNVSPWSTAKLVGRVYFVVALAAAVLAGAGYAALASRSLRLRHVALVAAGVAGVLALAYLGAEARDLLVAPGSVKQDALLMAGVAIAAGAALLAGIGRLSGRVMLPVALLVAALSLVDLRGLNVTLPASEAYPPTPASVRFLQDQAAPFRVQPVRTGDSAMPPNILALYGLESTEGYDFPLARRWADVQAAAFRYAGLMAERRVLIGPPDPAALPALRLFNVAFYLTEPGAPPPAGGFERVYEGDDASVYRDPEALPRAFVVPATRSLDAEAALAELSSPTFDARRVALVEPGAGRAPTGGAFRPARVERLAPDHLRVHLPHGAAGWLVVGNAWSAEWEATVDGRDAELHPTDYAAMGLPVTGDDREVDVRLDRSSYRLGALISLLALVAMVALGLRGRAQARPRASP